MVSKMYLDLREMKIKLLARPIKEDGYMEQLVELGNIVTLAAKVEAKREARIADNRCPLCGEGIKRDDFDQRDALYLEEFQISGLCPACQDDIFAEREVTDT